MAKSKTIRLSNDLIKKAEAFGKAQTRTVPMQIEHWAKIGKVMEENPDLTYEFVSGALEARDEIKLGQSSRYVFTQQ